MTTETRNEAAERLHERIDNWPINNDQKRDEHRKLDDALAAERRATVERIRPLAREVASLLRLRIPARGAEDDIGFSSEWQALDELEAVFDAIRQEGAAR